MVGLLNLNKPAGPTSHDIVAGVRRLVGRRVKVGHTGTLDPFARGVLVICLGQATRLAELVAEAPKQYEAEVTFGATSSTDDVEGQITPTGLPPPDEAALRTALAGFVGLIDQVPPQFSAVKVDGQRAYKLARREQDVVLTARPVRIDAVELLGLEGFHARLRIDCGGGTYIRALARDLGSRLGCGAYCSALTRTRVGQFHLADALDPDGLTAESLAASVLPARLAVAGWASVTLDPAQLADIRLGRAVTCPDLAADPSNTQSPDLVAALDAQGYLVALCRLRAADKMLVPYKVFPAEGAE